MRLRTWRRRLTDIVSLVPTGSLVATAKAVYVGPRLLIREGDFVRGKADDLSILLMELSLALDELTGQEAVDERQSRRSPKLGTRKIGERVKIKVVNSLHSRVLHAIKSVEDESVRRPIGSS